METFIEQATDRLEITYPIVDTAIDLMREQYLAIQVKGVNDKENYDLAKKALTDTKAKRIAVEKRRKELKADSLEFGRRVDSVAKGLTARLEEIESHLEAQRAIVDDEKARLAREEAEKKEAEINRRDALLRSVRAFYTRPSIEQMSEVKFEQVYSEAKAAFEAEQDRIKKEREEAERLRKEAEERERKLREQEAENRRLQEELIRRQQAEIEAQKQREAEATRQRQEAERKAEAERLAKEKAEKDRIEAIQRAEREKVAAEARRVQEEKDAAERLENQRLEAERRQAEAVKAAKEEAERKAIQAKALADYEAKEERRKAEEEAARKIANEKLFEEIKASFPTLESAWTEIARLRAELDLLA